jgi:Family of unknown function (DUF6262)
MRADNSHLISEAAQRKHAACLESVTAAIREADRLRKPVTVLGIAKAAGVSASWIYTQPEVFAAIRSRRDAGGSSEPVRPPIAERAGSSGQQKRIELLTSKLRQATDDNERLRRELANVHGELRRLRQHVPGQTDLDGSGKSEPS